MRLAIPIALLLGACTRGPDDTGAKPTDTVPTPTVDVDLVATATPATVPNVLEVAWTAPGPGTSWVEYGLDGALDRRTPDSDTTSVQVLGLKSTRSYSWRAVTALDSGEIAASPVMTYQVPPPPAGVPSVTVAWEDREASVIAGRYVLVQLGGLDRSWAVILDEDGDYVWALPFPEGLQISHVAVAHDRASLWITQMDKSQLQDLSRTWRYALDGTVLSDNRLPDQHHVAIERADGDLLWIAHTTRDVVQPDGEVWAVVSDEIRTAPEGATEAYTTLFSYLDEWIPWSVPCTHVATPEDYQGTFPWHEWTHTNSLIESPEENAYYIAPRLHDALLKLDSDTNDVLWQLGGADNDFTVAPHPSLVDGEALWSHGHTNEVWATGMLMFDNAMHPLTHGSRAQEWAIDQDRMTAELVWTYEDPEGDQMPLLGDVRRMPEGHRLVTWTTFGTMEEHVPGAGIPWSLEVSVGAVIGRPVVLESLYGLVEAAHE